MRVRQALILIAISALGGSLRAFADPAPPSATADEVKALRERIEALEQKQEDNLRISSQNTSLVHAFLNDRLTLGGFFESALTELHGPATEFQMSTASSTLGLNIAGEFSDHLSFSSQFITALAFPLVNPDNDPRAPIPSRRYSGYFLASVLSQAYLEYEASDLLIVQAGQGYAPFGIALQQRELVLFVRRGGPQLLRMNGTAAPLWQGLHVHGTMPFAKKRVGYNLYTFNSFNDPRLPGIGARAWTASRDGAITVGVSTQTIREKPVTYEIAGLDLKMKFGAFDVNAEFARTFAPGNQPYTFYVEPHYSLASNAWILYGFLDYGNNARAATALNPVVSLADPFRRMEYGFGVNWLPTSLTRLRMGLYYFDYLGGRAVADGPNRNFVATDLSVAVAF